MIVSETKSDERIGWLGSNRPADWTELERSASRESLTMVRVPVEGIRTGQKWVYCLCVPVKYKIPTAWRRPAWKHEVVVARNSKGGSHKSLPLCRHRVSPEYIQQMMERGNDRLSTYIYLQSFIGRELFFLVYFLALCLLTGQGIFMLKGYRTSDRASCTGNRIERPGSIVDGSSIITCMWQVEPTDRFERSDAPRRVNIKLQLLRSTGAGRISALVRKLWYRQGRG